MYKARTAEEILSELQNYSALDESKVEGTFSFDVFSSNSLEFGKFATELETFCNESFGQTASGDYLELRCGEAGVYRRAGRKAVGEVQVTGTGIVRAGAVFATENNLRFVALSDTAVTDSGTVAVEALTEGAAFNVPAHSVIKMPMSIAGIRACDNPLAMFNGYDTESDEQLRERWLDKVRYPPASGNARHYIFWAREISGVGAVRVWRLWRGAGTVKVIIIDSNFQPANVLLLEEVWRHIEDNRPIGAQVSVVSARPKSVDISANVKGSVDLDAFTESVRQLFIKVTNSWDIDYSRIASYENPNASMYISLAQIGALIIAAGADDYSDLKLNGAAANVELGIEEIAVPGVIDL